MNNKREIEKQKKKELIIIKSRELFVTKGYESTSMNDIVKATDLTKRTIYRYFQNKEDLYFCVASSVYNDLWKLVNSNMEKGSSAIVKIELACEAFRTFYKNDRELLKIMSITNTINTNSKDSSYKKEFYYSNTKMYRLLYKIFESGVKDKTIKNDIDIKYTISSFMFSILSFFSMLSLTGNSFVEYMRLNETEFIDYTLNMHIKSIKS